MTLEICGFTKKANPFIILQYYVSPKFPFNVIIVWNLFCNPDKFYFYIECKKVLQLYFLIQMNSQPFGIRHSSPIGSKPIFNEY